MLLRRPLREAPATPTFYALTAVAAFCFALCFTLNLVFQFRVIGLDPFQMVLVGTVLELTCFVFEVPTGIVADLYSRRVSVIVGFVLIGAGFVTEGVVATFAAAVAGTIAAGNARETGRSPWPAVVASGLGVAAMSAVTSRRR